MAYDYDYEPEDNAIPVNRIMGRWLLITVELGIMNYLAQQVWPGATWIRWVCLAIIIVTLIMSLIVLYDMHKVQKLEEQIKELRRKHNEK